MKNEQKDLFCITKVERTSSSEFNFELVIQSGRVIEGQGTIGYENFGQRPLRVFNFKAKDGSDPVRYREVDPRKVMRLLKLFEDLPWYEYA